MEEHVAVLGQLDLSRPSHEHLKRSAGAEVRLEDALEALGGGDVDGARSGLADDLSVRV